MVRPVIPLWSITLLSALCFSAAFFFSDSLGFLIFFAFAFLFYSFFSFSKKQWWQWICSGMLWGSIVFGLHFIWLYVLLATKSHASSLLAFVLYFVVVGYTTTTAVIWFCMTGYVLQKSNYFFIKMAIVVTTTWLYFLFYQHYALIFIGNIEGYPFLNPCIPLARYALVMRLFSFVCGIVYGRDVVPPQPLSYDLIHLKPVKTGKGAVGQHLYHQLTMSTIKTDTSKSVVFVAPESFFSFPLNQEREIRLLWHHALLQNAHLMVGSHYQDTQGGVCQAVYHIRDKQNIDVHGKSHCVAFVEKMPPFLKKCTILRTLFLHNLKDLTEFQEKDVFKVFRITPEEGVIPVLCSEFFWKKNTQELLNAVQNDVTIRRIFFFVNDSWFIEYFRRIMENLVYIKATQLGVAIVWIGHFSCKQIDSV